jgi:hypothetical protein
VETIMACKIIPFPRAAANDNRDDIPPFDPANSAHRRPWRTMYLFGREELKRRMEGGR